MYEVCVCVCFGSSSSNGFLYELLIFQPTMQQGTTSCASLSVQQQIVLVCVRVGLVWVCRACVSVCVGVCGACLYVSVCMCVCVCVCGVNTNIEAGRTN